jgi:hypothetical protein
MYEMVNIFEVFLPQLLRYPNPTDPLNGEAAALMMREPKTYEAKVKGKRRSKYLTSTTRLIAVRICFQVRIERGSRGGRRRLGRR